MAMRLTQLILTLAALPALALAQTSENSTITIDQNLKLDDLGNGTMTLKLTLTGLQFQNWQARYGQNQSLLKRDMSKYVSQFLTTDWDVQEKQMDRVVQISCKFKGAVLHKGGGVYEFRVPKQWRGGERNGTVYSYNYIEPSGAAIVQTNVKLMLPENASNFAEDKAENGERIVQYTVPVDRMGKLLLWGGGGAVAIGLLLALFGMMKKPAPAPQPGWAPAGPPAV
jgi:hypothetical protein